MFHYRAATIHGILECLIICKLEQQYTWPDTVSNGPVVQGSTNANPHGLKFNRLFIWPCFVC